MYRIETPSGVLAACRACGGFWLDNVACRALIKGALGEDATGFARTFVGAVPSAVTPGDGYRQRADVPRCCPVCQGALALTETREPVLHVDVCKEHGTFFDAREVAAVISAVDARSWDRQLQDANLQARVCEAQMDAEANQYAMYFIFGSRPG